MAGRSQTRIGIRDRLGQLTYRGACRLLGEGDEGAKRLRQAGRFQIHPQEGIYLGGDLLRVTVPDPALPAKVARVTAVEMTRKPQGLQLNCDACSGHCDHVAAALSFVLEEKLLLGLSAAPDPNEPLENLTEEELLRRALAEREQRAKEEKMTVRPQEADTPWTDYAVTSGHSGKTYRVSLRGRDIGESYCSCPDFRTNHLGTCKHILQVQGRIAKRFSQKELAKPYRRKNLSLRMDYGPTLGLKFNLPSRDDEELADLLKSAAGKTLADAKSVLRLLQKLERSGKQVHVYPDAEEFLQERLLREKLQSTAAEIRKNTAKHPLRKELLKTELLPYQLDGIAFAAGAGRAVLADDMGLGKTIQGIGVAELLAREAGIRRVLIVTPASLKSQWQTEIDRFSNRDCQIVLGTASERLNQFVGDAFFTICNYEQLLRDHTAVERTPWDLIILDEGQRIKNWEARTTRVVKSLRSRFALVLSGTPLENRLEELFAVISFIDDRRLGPAYRFFHQHRMVDDRGRVEGYRNLDQLRAAIAPILLRRTRASVLGELPERTTEIVRIRPTEEQLTLNNEHLSEAARIAAKRYLTEMDLLMLQKHLMMARMAADSTVLVDHEPPGFSSKLERLKELLEALAAEDGRKIILFSEWTRMLDLIEPILITCGLNFVRLDGKVPQKKRPDIVHRFQNEANCRVILLSNAGSTGLNLQAANTVINVDLPWNPAVLEQRIARAHRMGQKRPVQVYLLVTEDTLEERLLGTLSAKHDLALAALDAHSDVTEVELKSGMEELKRRLERLLGAQPAAPVDASQLVAVNSQNEQFAARREKVAAAGGELLGAAMKLVGELIAGPVPDANSVQAVRAGLTQCAERDEQGRMQLKFTLPDEAALEGLANTLARLLVASAAE